MVNLLCHEVNPGRESSQCYTTSNLLSTAVNIMVGRSFGNITVLMEPWIRCYGITDTDTLEINKWIYYLTVRTSVEQSTD
jgi:hypothetical protein